MTVSSLDSALSGLRTARSALNVVSNNISNATTEGYTRKILPQEAVLTTSGQTLGVRVTEIIRQVDETLLKDMYRAHSDVAQWDVRESYLQRIQMFHGSSDSEQAISAQISRLSESFSAAANSPEDPYLLTNIVNEAQQTVQQINDFSQMLIETRNDAQNDIQSAVVEINSLLETISSLNNDIGSLQATERSSAALEDQRDIALLQLSEYIDIKTFPRENGKITVMTAGGQSLVEDAPYSLIFNPTTLSPASFYGDGSTAGLFIDIPNSTNDLDITEVNIGGKVGALLELRDTTLPQYNAQIDELAQKLAVRFDSQGLRLFSDRNGQVPASVADPGLVGYIGFAAEIQVNPSIINDHSLIRSGTTGDTVLAGSSEVLNRVVEYAFGKYQYEMAEGTVDLIPGTINARTGLTDSAQFVASVDIAQTNPLESDPNITAGMQFSVDLGAGAQTITINAGDSANTLANSIKAAHGIPLFSDEVRINSLGQLVIESTADITIADVSLGASGMAALGLTAGVTAAEHPSFTIQVSGGSEIVIEVDPASDVITGPWITQLNSIDNLIVGLNVVQGLTLTPENGGGITLIDGLGSPLAAMGIVIEKVLHEPFRQNNLGADGNLTTELVSIQTLEEYSRAIITLQSEDHQEAVRQTDTESVFFNTLKARAENQHGVNIDQEMAHMIRIQSAYTAAAKIISVDEELMDTLLNAIR